MTTVDSVGAGSSDAALTSDLSQTITAILPALDQFIRFDGPDLAAHRSRWQAALEEPLPETGDGPARVVELLNSIVIPSGLRTGHPGFAGWVTTMPTTIATAAALAGNVSAAQRWWVSPGNFLEELALRWLSDLLGLRSTYQGVFVSGGSIANLVGLGAARQHAGERRGSDPARDGLAGLGQARVYAAANVHHVVTRSMAILGLGRSALRGVPHAANGVMDAAALATALQEDLAAGITPVAVVASAGDVNLGAVDPIAEIIGVAREHGVWVHVDGAYGGFGVLDKRVAPLYVGIDEADSIAVDPHKWMAVPIGCGATFVRDRELLGRAFTLEPSDYLQGEPPATGDVQSAFDELGYEFHDYAIEQSSRSRGLTVWAVLKEIGAAGMRDRVRRHLDLARRVALRALEEPELELLAEPVLSICCFRFRPGSELSEEALDLLNERVLKGVRARGRCVPSGTRVEGRFAIRPCFINPRSTLDDADALVDEVLAVGRQLT